MNTCANAGPFEVHDIARRHARYSVLSPNNIILPKPGIGGSLQFLQGSPGTLFCSGGVPPTFYRGPRGPFFRCAWVPSNFYRGLQPAPSAMEGFPSCFARVPGDPLVQWRIFPHVLQGSLGTPCAMEGFPMFYKGPWGPPSSNYCAVWISTSGPS